MQHNLIRILLVVERIPFTPIVAHRVRKDIPAAVKVRCRDRATHLRVPFESVLGVLVPEVEGPVRASGAEGAVLWVEGDGVDGEDVTAVAVVLRRLAVAFEAEVVALVFFLDVLDGAAPFDAADCEAAAVGEGADYSCLPLERALHCLEEGCRILEIDDVDMAFCCADNQHFVASDVHAVDAISALDARDGLLLP